MSKLAVIALGGNALLSGDQAGNIDEKAQNTIETLENIVFLVREGYSAKSLSMREDRKFGTKITMEYED